MENDALLGERFPLRPVALGEANQLLHESIVPFRAFPAQLTLMFLALWIPVELLRFAPPIGPFLRDVASAVAFTGYTVALDAAARFERPEIRHLAVVVRFDFEKLMMLVLSGLLPIVAS